MSGGRIRRTVIALEILVVSPFIRAVRRENEQRRQDQIIANIQNAHLTELVELVAELISQEKHGL